MDFTRSLFSSSDVTGCGYIRSFLPARYLDGHFMGGFNRNQPVDFYTNFVFQRQSHKDFLEIIPNIQRLGKKVYYDIDDDLWTIDKENPAKKAFDKEKLNVIGQLISLSDGIICSTEYLKTKLSHLHDKIYVTPNLIEIPNYPKEKKTKIRIGYAGSLSHAGDFSKKLIYALQKLYGRYHKKIEFVFVGYVPPELKDIAQYIAGVHAPDYLQLLNHLDFDIFIIPLADTEFNKSKSNLKWLDAAISGACPVLSPVFCYNEVEHEKTGFFVQDEQWFFILEYLINNDEVRREVANNAYEYILQNYTWRYAAQKQKDVYNLIP